MAGRRRAQIRQGRKLFLEQLEGRQLMAGIVNVIISGTEILLEEAPPLPGEFEVPNGVQMNWFGENGGTVFHRLTSTTTGTPNDFGTTFRLGTTGPASSTLILPGLPNTIDLTVKLKGGDDKFVYNQGIPGTYTSTSFRDAAIDMGFGGKDQVEASFLRISRDWKIWGGQPQPPPEIQAPVISLGRAGPNSVGRDFCYFGGNGNDDITMLGTTIVRHVVRPPDPGPTTYRLPCPTTPMLLRDGNDKFTISNAPTGPNFVGVGNPASRFLLDAGPGNDAISSTGLTVNEMMWDLGDGNDTVFFRSTSIGENSIIDGGAGYDQFTESMAVLQNNFQDCAIYGTPADPGPPPVPANWTPPFPATAPDPPQPPPPPLPPAQPPPPSPNSCGDGPTSSPPVQRLPNPGQVMIAFWNFENGQPGRPSGSGGGGGGGGFIPACAGGGRWCYRQEDTVEVSTANSPNLAGLESLLALSALTGQYPQGSAQIVDGKLLVTGTDKNDFIFLSDAGNGLVRVRVGSRILGTFLAEAGVAVDSLGGRDYIYVAPTIGAASMVAATANEDFVIGGLNLLLFDNNRVYANQQASEHSQFMFDPNSAAAHDLALLEILGLPQGGTDSNSIYSSWQP